MNGEYLLKVNGSYLTANTVKLDAISRRVYCKEFEANSNYQKWNIQFTNLYTKNCDKLYLVKNTNLDEYLHANNSYVFNSNRRHAFTAKLNTNNISKSNDFGYLWIFQKRSNGFYYMYNYLTYEYFYKSSFFENSMILPFTYISYKESEWVDTDFKRSWILETV